ncbi:sugar (and other) transporter family protein [Burkholderia gladioli]|uniref:Sugar (And other) transporter family protein n=1 Tax=Burkholderia gladioli TaxID=28095 RepID=A0AAW3F1M4_BURGA|nr:MFS transporter [Burkholderia gladioli]AJW94516.1 sugar (and other) transporter family protein [Burkholderia gladioli]ASD83767.1 aromatic acid/H+ symport family MFS transporter [Burkholderia gladioli pv. gladioli]AWY52833.1 aromatic acid/H+ symport family MFS transporter [Burkholderia gladioli pv. gladioli]KGC14673.1 sugar (and other) transporter family protein [Burkholderia gladioli]SPV09281.1 Major facilitator superfamily MFS_1 [Burkholderia gladioli]
MSRSPVVNVQTFINEQPFGAFQWLIFLMCFVIVLLDGFDTAAIGFIAPSLLSEWHLSKPDLAPVLSAALFGLACGALASGPLSDRLGRRALLIGSVLLFGVACLGSAFSSSIGELTTLRFVTGVGLGAAMPNAVTMMGEFCPDKRRATVINLMFCGFPLGAAFGGFLAAWMIPQFGWRSVLMLGGIAPLVLVVALLAQMPESVRFMVATGKPLERIRETLARVSATAMQAGSFVMTETAPQTGGKGAAVVLSRQYIVGSVMLWIAYFMGLVIFYASINWMPILLKDAGLAPKTATLISALFPLGGVGAVLSGVLMDRFNANRVVAVCYALTAVSVYFIGQAAGNVGALVLIVFLAGVLMNTAQSSLPALAAAFYPTAGRGTGVAWMLGIGRFGGIAGSFLVAELAARHVSFANVFATIAVAGLMSCVALLVKQSVRPQQAAPGGEKIESLGH